MEKNVLQSIAGVAIYPIISFAIFFLFFLGLALYVLFIKRQHVDAMRHLPFDDDPSRSDEALKYHLNHDILC